MVNKVRFCKNEENADLPCEFKSVSLLKNQNCFVESISIDIAKGELNSNEIALKEIIPMLKRLNMTFGIPLYDFNWLNSGFNKLEQININVKNHYLTGILYGISYISINVNIHFYIDTLIISKKFMIINNTNSCNKQFELEN